MARQKHQPWQQVKKMDKIVIESITQKGNDLTVNLEVNDSTIDVIKIEITETEDEVETQTEIPTVPGTVSNLKSNKKVSNLLKDEKN
jgi:hypothetical protein